MITIICGAPGAGKTTYALDHAKKADLVIDWDLIAQELGSPRTHLHDRHLFHLIADEWDRRIATAHTHHGDVWIVRAKTVSEVQPLADLLEATVVELTESRDVLLARVSTRHAADWQRRKLIAWLAERPNYVTNR